ncbi:MAG: hypothetical protein ACTSU2_06735 [Promethearchaeota archaeon]
MKIRHLLLIRENGTAPFVFNQDQMVIDQDLLSGFCMAIYSISKELQDSLDLILMKNKNKIIFSEFFNTSNEKFIMAAICDKDAIDEGVRNKMGYIFDKYFNEYVFDQMGLVINDNNILEGVRDDLNESNLRKIVERKRDELKAYLDRILEQKENDIYAYALTSSSNEILLLNMIDTIKKYHPDESEEDIIGGYLRKWDIKKIPQGDIYYGLETGTGIDLNYFYEENNKIFGLGINTAINTREEPQNELLLYFFGYNTLMRQVVINIEEILRDIINKDNGEEEEEETDEVTEEESSEITRDESVKNENIPVEGITKEMLRKILKSNNDKEEGEEEFEDFDNNNKYNHDFFEEKRVRLDVLPKIIPKKKMEFEFNEEEIKPSLDHNTKEIGPKDEGLKPDEEKINIKSD